MTYDRWKTTEREEEEQPSELELVYRQLFQARDAAEVTAARIKRLEADLAECLDYFKDRYDVVDGDYGEPAPNKEMQLGAMIDETLHGIRF